jgi:uncharacterized protein
MSTLIGKFENGNQANDPTAPGFLAFESHRCLASGDLPEIVRGVKEAMKNPNHGPILIFDSTSSRQVEIDFRGSIRAVLERLGCGSPAESTRTQERRGPGRPKLGVLGREVTLLPRHWDWLDGQPGGASVALRKLVEQARKSNREKDRARLSQEAVYRFMSVMGGDLPGFEEALRAFYRGNQVGVAELIKGWPADIRDHVQRLIATASRDSAEAAKPERRRSQINMPG